MKLTKTLSLLTFFSLITLLSWYGTRKLGADLMIKLGAGAFGVGAVLQLTQTFTNSKNKEKENV